MSDFIRKSICLLRGIPHIFRLRLRHSLCLFVDNVVYVRPLFKDRLYGISATENPFIYIFYTFSYLLYLALYSIEVILFKIGYQPLFVLYENSYLLNSFIERSYIPLGHLFYVFYGITLQERRYGVILSLEFRPVYLADNAHKNLSCLAFILVKHIYEEPSVEKIHEHILVFAYGTLQPFRELGCGILYVIYENCIFIRT